MIVKKPRNLFTTKTMAGAFSMVAGFAIATTPLVDAATPIVVEMIGRKLNQEQSNDIKSALGLFVVVGGFLRTAYGRHQASSEVYTPAGMPGRDKKDVDNIG